MNIIFIMTRRKSSYRTIRYIWIVDVHMLIKIHACGCLYLVTD